jgi:hypothetical protein
MNISVGCRGIKIFPMKDDQGWKFAQCFGDKGEDNTVVEGKPSICLG